MSDWRMQRMQSTGESLCSALMREVGDYKAIIHYTAESQQWNADIIHEGMLLMHSSSPCLLAILSRVNLALDSFR